MEGLWGLRFQKRAAGHVGGCMQRLLGEGNCSPKWGFVSILENQILGRRMSTEGPWTQGCEGSQAKVCVVQDSDFTSSGLWPVSSMLPDLRRAGFLRSGAGGGCEAGERREREDHGFSSLEKRLPASQLLGTYFLWGNECHECTLCVDAVSVLHPRSDES